jgi:coenzyme F420-0:L-glutamate ligase
MKIHPLKIDNIIQPGDNLIDIILEALDRHSISPVDGDIIAISAKIVSITEKYVLKLNEIEPSNNALEIGKRYSIDPRIVELLLRENAKILGGKQGVLATIHKGILIGNAGFDRKNIPKDYITKWPTDPDREAEKIMNELYKKLKVKLGIIIVDSRVLPLRIGTVGFALGSAGVEVMRDYRGRKDLHGKKILYTVHNIVDELAAAAHLYMGEGDEKIPIVYIEKPPAMLVKNQYTSILRISIEDCLYMGTLLG